MKEVSVCDVDGQFTDCASKALSADYTGDIAKAVNVGNEKFENSFQDSGSVGSTVPPVPAFSRIEGHGTTEKHPREDSNLRHQL